MFANLYPAAILPVTPSGILLLWAYKTINPANDLPNWHLWGENASAAEAHVVVSEAVLIAARSNPILGLLIGVSSREVTLHQHNRSSKCFNSWGWLSLPKAHYHLLRKQDIWKHASLAIYESFRRAERVVEEQGGIFRAVSSSVQNIE